MATRPSTLRTTGFETMSKGKYIISSKHGSKKSDILNAKRICIPKLSNDRLQNNQLTENKFSVYFKCIEKS
jgi:hypothetical protein